MVTNTNEQSSSAKRRKPVPEETRDHYRKAREEMREAFETLLPEGFVEHRRAARREMLLAWRSLIDAAIRRMDEKS
ncbi:MAG: hypothetical protein ACM3QS_00445 [Bacteroidota bacterium]